MCVARNARCLQLLLAEPYAVLSASHTGMIPTCLSLTSPCVSFRFGCSTSWERRSHTLGRGVQQPHLRPSHLHTARYLLKLSYPRVAEICTHRPQLYMDLATRMRPRTSLNCCLYSALMEGSPPDRRQPKQLQLLRLSEGWAPQHAGLQYCTVVAPPKEPDLRLRMQGRDIALGVQNTNTSHFNRTSAKLH